MWVGLRDREGGIQGLPLRGAAGEPGVGAAIEMEQLAKARARLAAAAVAPSGAPLADEPGFLQSQFDEAIGAGHPMIPAGEVVKVAHVEAEIPLPVQAQDRPRLGQGAVRRDGRRQRRS